MTLPRPYPVQGHGAVVFALHKPKRLACERLPGKRRPDVDWSARAAAGCHLCRSSPPQLLGRDTERGTRGAASRGVGASLCRGPASAPVLHRDLYDPVHRF